MHALITEIGASYYFIQKYLARKEYNGVRPMSSKGGQPQPLPPCFRNMFKFS